MTDKLKKQAVSGVMWRVLEVVGTRGIQFVISIFLARLVMPDQFGALAMLTIFTAVLGSFVSSGFPAALLRKTDRTQQDCSTMFWFNIAMSVVVYIILFAIAPLVADFCSLPVLCPLLRVVSLSVILSAPTVVQSTLYQAELKFKPLAVYNMIGVLMSGVTGIIMALCGMEVWALAAQVLVSTAVTTAVMWIRSAWRPTWQFSWQSLRSFFDFGWKLQASELLNTIYINIFGVVIGKVYRAADLAYYNRAGGLVGMTTIIPTNVLQSVTYPLMCKLQHDNEALRANYRKMIRLSAFAVFPICLLLGAVAWPAISVIYGEQWIDTAPILQIMAFAMMLYPIHSLNLNLLQVKGRTDLFFRLEIIKKVLGVGILCITLPMGIMAICYGQIASSVICLVINTHYTSKLLHLGLWTQIRDLAPSILLSVLLFGVSYLLATIIGNSVIALCVSVVAGLSIYLLAAWLLRLPELSMLRTAFASLINR